MSFSRREEVDKGNLLLRYVVSVRSAYIVEVFIVLIFNVFELLLNKTNPCLPELKRPDLGEVDIQCERMWSVCTV